jgi:hypothetical protein
MSYVKFIGVGTQKGGTSALDGYLRAHPGLCLPKLHDIRTLGRGKLLAAPKEPHFFDTEEYFQQGEVDYRIYHAFFSPLPGQMCGECTPIYMYWHDAPRRMWEYNPDLKLIVLLRNPMARAYSHWNMMCALRLETLPFEAAITHETERCRAALPLQDRIYSYVERGFYSEQLRRLWRFFPPSQVLVLKSEDLYRTPQTVLDQVCAFLKVAPLRVTAPLIANQGKYRQSLNATAKAHLQQIFYYEIKMLESMLGWDCSDWLGA